MKHFLFLGKTIIELDLRQKSATHNQEVDIFSHSPLQSESQTRTIFFPMNDHLYVKTNLVETVKGLGAKQS